MKKTFYLQPHTKVVRMLPVDPNQEIPEVLGLGKTDYLQFYRVKHPYTKQSPWRSKEYDQDHLFQIETDSAYQFGLYWLTPYQSSATCPLTCLYEKDDVTEKWEILSHPTLLKALNEQYIPYSYFGNWSSMENFK